MADENSQEQQFLNPSRRSYVYESSRTSRGNKRVILIIIGIIILVALVAFAVIATGGKGENEKNLTPTITQPTATPSPTLSQPPTPTGGETTPTPTSKLTPSPSKSTPTPTSSTKTSTLDRANLTIAVLNGSGVAGAATKASDALKKLGYDVVSSGNADNFDYETTTIQVKSTKKNYLDLLKSDLSDIYTVGTATADYTGNSDAVVIVGKK